MIAQNLLHNSAGGIIVVAALALAVASGAGCSDTIGGEFSPDDDSNFDFQPLPAVQQDYLQFRQAKDRRDTEVGEGLDLRADDPMSWRTRNLCEKGRIEAETKYEGSTGKAKMFFSQRPARRKTVFGLGDGSSALRNNYLDPSAHYERYRSPNDPESPTFNLIIRHPTVDLDYNNARDDLLERLPSSEVDSVGTFMDKCGTAFESRQERGIILVGSIQLDLVSNQTRQRLRELTELNGDGSGNPTIMGEMVEEWAFEFAQEKGLGELSLKVSPLRGAPSLDNYRNPDGRITFSRLEDYIEDVDEAVGKAVEKERDDSPFYGSILGRYIATYSGSDLDRYEVAEPEGAEKAFRTISEALRARRPSFSSDSPFWREIPFAFHMAAHPEWYEFDAGYGYPRDEWMQFVEAYRACVNQTIPAWHDQLVGSFEEDSYQAVEDNLFPSECQSDRFHEDFNDIRRRPLLAVP